MAAKITRDVVESHLKCKSKSFLKLAGHPGNTSEYEQLRAAARLEIRQKVIGKIVALNPAGELAKGVPLTAAALRSGPSFVLDATLEDDAFSLGFDGLKRVDGPSQLGNFHYIPILFHEGRKIGQDQRLLLDVFCLFLCQIQGRLPATGMVFLGRELRSIMARVSSDLRRAERFLRELKELAFSRSPPSLILNNHCSVCEFRQRCRDQAEQEGSLSLLRGMGEKEITKLGRRGIFTVTQLSYTYRPRKASDRDRQIRGHSFALQAMAIRENKIYVLGNPELQESPVRIYFDIEGDPESASAYLLGVIIDDGQAQERFSFWADDQGQEELILKGFLDLVERHPGCRLICYGNFEIAFLRRMSIAGSKERIDQVLDRTTNILPTIYSSLYLPVFSNGLKEIASHLGFRWTEPDASGLQCIVWRTTWEATRDEKLRRKIEVYNLEDCAALRTVAQFIRWVGARSKREDGARQEDEALPNYSRIEDYVVPFRRPEWGNANFLIPDFDHINRLSYFEYQRDRVFIRSSKRLRIARSRSQRSQGRKKIKVHARFEIRCKECPFCKSVQMSEWSDERHSRVVKDLGITTKGITRRFVQVTSPRYRCKACRRTFAPPEYYRVDTHSRSLKSWAIYEHVAHRVSFENLGESLRDCFGLRLSRTNIHEFNHLMARHCEATFEQLRSRIVSGSVIHADETTVNMKGIGRVYVWVFTNLEEVIYLYRPSREGGFLHAFLNGFGGVLVSDFYAAYDSLPCAQQKCLIHLIRDFNQDIVSNPFDEELKALAADFGRLLRTAVTTIDRHGLKRKHLFRHTHAAKRFLKALSGGTYRSSVVQSYQARFEKYRDKLFTFLSYDGVPWNNNNAEHAIKRFAYYREIADSLLTERGLNDYLILLSIYQTCVYKGVSFLNFLVSQEQDIDRFCESGPRRREVLPYDLYPEGYITPRRRRKAPKEEVPSAKGPVANDLDP